MNELLPGYHIGGLSAENLAEGLANRRCRPDEVSNHREFEYLLGYLCDIGVRTMVVEEQYTDGDYLDDYTFYYAKAWEGFDRRCKRIHFFSTRFTGSRLRKIALGRPGSSRGPNPFEKALRSSYCGFVVARPLPSAVIGRTVLKTYENDSNRRRYTTLRTYTANLLGLEFSVESLAFQEQDETVAACATVALWSAFQKTATLFHTAIPTPAAITSAATQVVHPQRPVPTRGLNVSQLGQAIRSVALEPEILVASRDVPFASMIYAYLEAELPVVLIAKVEGIGYHAITLAGYSLITGRSRWKHEIKAKRGDRSRPALIGRRIDRFYGHDDQIGPFARMSLGPEATVGDEYFPRTLVGEWKDQETGAQLTLYPHSIVVPVYHKIRVTFVEAYQWVVSFSEVLEGVKGFDSKKAEWNLRLTTTNRLKAQLSSGDVGGAEIERMLTCHHPRFIWRASLTFDGIPTLDLLGDATGIPHDLHLYHVAWLAASLKEAFRQLLATEATRAGATGVLGAQCVRLIEEQLREAL